MAKAPATAPGSLSEGAAERSEAEGVSSDGSSGPVVYPQAIIGSEIFERLRSSGYTPSVSHSLDSSLKEGAGMGCVPFIRPLGNRKVSGDFHRPYERAGSIHRAARKAGGCGRFSSPLRRLRSFYIPPFIGGEVLPKNLDKGGGKG